MQKSDKIWADAIHRAIKEYKQEKGADGKIKKERYLRVLAQQLVDKAASGDIAALKEIGDRLDGKPRQQTEVSGPNGGSIQTDNKWIIEVVRPDAKAGD